MSSRGNLPSDVGGFVGRAVDLGELDARIDAGERLITLTGPGGIGKTRLAIKWASTRRDRFPGGAWIVDLASARDLDALSAAVARALDLAVATGASEGGVDRIGRQLAAQGRALIVLDNLEQLVEVAADAIARCHAAAPELTIVATSREALRVRAESRWELAPIPLPEPDAAPDRVTASEAFALLADRVRRARGSWDPGPAEIAAAGALLRRLDGIPLAIELAAARLATLDTASLLDRLGRSIDALGAGPRDGAARQRTLRTTVEWSLDLLSPAELDAFAACGVFEGGFGAEAAQAVLATPDAIEILAALRDRSLVRGYEPAGMPGVRRSGMYETIAALARERLDRHPRAAEIRRRHAVHVIEGAEELARRVERGGGRGALQRLELEQENLLAATERLIAERSERDLAFRGVLALDPVLSVQGLFARKLGLYDALISAFPDAPPRWLALALEGRGLTLNTLGRRTEGTEELARALAIAEQIGDRALEGRLHRAIGRAEWSASERAIEHVERSIAILREVDDRRELGLAINTLAVKRYELGKRDAAVVMFRESQKILAEVGDARWEGITWCQIGLAAIEAARWDEAERAIEAATRLAEADGAWNVKVMVEQARATLALMLARLDEAADRFDEVLRVHRRVANRPFEGIQLGYRAIVDRERGRADESRRAYESAIAILAEVGESSHRAIFAAQLGGLEASLGRDAIALERLDEAEALALAQPLPGVPTVIELERAHLDLLRAERALAEGDRRAARVARESALARRARADEMEPEERTSIDVRLSKRVLDRALGAARAPSLVPAAAAPEEALAVQRDGAWFRMPRGERVGCAGKHVSRRLLMALVHARVEASGIALSRDRMLEAGWPGEKIHPEAARNRLHVAISGLRKLGLDAAIQNVGEGYRLDPDLALVVVD